MNDPDTNITASFDKIILHAGNSRQQQPRVSSFSGAEVETSSVCRSTSPDDEQGNCLTQNGPQEVG